MTGAGLAAVLAAGARAGALGTAFLRCPEAGDVIGAPGGPRHARAPHCTHPRVHWAARSRDQQPLPLRAHRCGSRGVPARPPPDSPAASPRAKRRRWRPRQPLGGAGVRACRRRPRRADRPARSRRSAYRPRECTSDSRVRPTAVGHCVRFPGSVRMAVQTRSRRRARTAATRQLSAGACDAPAQSITPTVTSAMHTIRKPTRRGAGGVDSDAFERPVSVGREPQKGPHPTGLSEVKDREDAGETEAEPQQHRQGPGSGPHPGARACLSTASRSGPCSPSPRGGSSAGRSGRPAGTSRAASVRRRRAGGSPPSLVRGDR